MFDLSLAILVIFLLLGLVRVLMVPLALVFEIRDRRRRRRGDQGLLPNHPFHSPLVSVVVAAYNEQKVVSACVASILECGYPNLEVVVVDDGSNDRTLNYLTRMAANQPRLRVFTQVNAGKGAALNHGIRMAFGDIVMLVDADGLFGPDTIPEMLRAFHDERVGAVCGSDRPVNLDRLQTRFLAVISHVGTGLVRRALDLIGCVPVVSGNVGAFRRSALNKVAVPGMGPLRTDTLGEDLELTWRLHRAGYRVAFAPRAIVHAESPSTVLGLWKQRVRWSRGLLQSLVLHSDMIGRPRYGVFGMWLAFTVITMIGLPIRQLIGALVLPVLWFTALWQLPVGVLAWITGSGLLLASGLVLIAVALDRSLRDLRYAWTLPIWPLYSLAMSATLVKGLIDELRGSPQRWNKLERTGVVSPAIAGGAGGRRTPIGQRV